MSLTRTIFFAMRTPVVVGGQSYGAQHVMIFKSRGKSTR